ncbi:FACR1 reductase, partial [Pseudoatta argentina]
MDKMIVDPTKSIPAFYAGQSILLTGATGFLGKIFIEKILRSCPDVREIFLLMRPKKELSIKERLDKILNLPIYEKLGKERSSNFEKLIPISGDINEKILGLSAMDRQMLIERVTIIIHAAADVKFNNSIKHAIFANTRATRDICILAQNMKNLIALVYVSTAFAHVNEPFIDEKIYLPIADWQKIIEIVETLDEHTLNIFTAKCLDYAPNTYIFSKNLAEKIIQDYSSSLPCAIIRPSIVTTTFQEPFLGWLDNVYGPIGLSIAAGKGILQVACMNESIKEDIIPVDILTKILIVVTWKVGLTTYDHRLVRLQRAIYVVNSALSYFTFHQWKFNSANKLTVMSLIPHDDIYSFSFDISNFDFKTYCKNSIIGAKKYLLHEDINQLDAVKAHNKRVYLFVRIIKTIIFIGVLWIIYKWTFFGML